MKQFTKILSLVLALTLLLTFPVGTSAAETADASIDTARTGSLTIYKYDLSSAEKDGVWDSSYVSTGVFDQSGVNDVLGSGKVGYGYAIQGVEFSYLKVAEIVQYSESQADGRTDSHVEVLYAIDKTLGADFLKALNLADGANRYTNADALDDSKYFYQSDVLIDALATALEANSTVVKNALESYIAENGSTAMPLTDAYGKTQAENLELGLYLVVETKVPEMVVSTTDPFLVSVPMTSVDGTNASDGGSRWIYDITLYPKNLTGIRANSDYRYRKAVRDDPSFATSNPVSRYLHKRRIQRENARQFRQAQKTSHTARGFAARAKEAAQAAVSFSRNHSSLLLPVLGVGLILVMLMGGISSCSMMAGSGVSSVLSTSYLSEDADILAAEAAYCAMEAELQEYLDTYRSPHSYDEYHFNLDTIEHDPYVLISILSALHERVFTIEEVQDDLEMLFEKQYILTENVETETRYRTEVRIEERPKRDPITGEILYDKYGNSILEEYEYEEVVPYTYYICTVELENFDLSHVPVYIMGEETLAV